MADHIRRISIWDRTIVTQAMADSFRKLDPRIQIKNPVMFIVEAGSLLMYGVGGVALPFVGIKAIDVILVAVGLV